MEMMIVLLITAIVAAAGAPLVTRKMMDDTRAGSSPWIYTGHNQSIAYNLGGKTSTAIIGATKVPNGTTPKLYIESSGDEAQIGFGRAGSNDVISLTMDIEKGRVGFSDANITDNTIAMGTQQTIDSDSTNSIILGTNVKLEDYKRTGKAYTIGSPFVFASLPSSDHSIAVGSEIEVYGSHSIAIGRKAKVHDAHGMAIGNETEAKEYEDIAIGRTSKAAGYDSLALGVYARATGYASTSIGHGAYATGEGAIALGSRPNSRSDMEVNTEATGDYSIAIGSQAQAKHNYSVAIGTQAVTTANNQIVLGTPNDTVYIPGNLVVGKRTVLGRDLSDVSSVWLRANPLAGSIKRGWVSDETNRGLIFTNTAQNMSTNMPSWVSDRRLKNIGEKYTAGVNELSKLDFFHYTFKKDANKAPHVGVIAQDLQEVFPDAVTKGDDGFLRIRWEDMFYAAINAIKELNTKIIEIANNLTSTNTKVEEQDKIIKEQQKIIDNQQKTIEKQQKSIDDLIRRMEKVEKTGKI